jgi:hypothetical protein
MTSHKIPDSPVSDARASIGRYLDFYNGRRPHSSLDGTTPDHAHFTPLPLRSLTPADAPLIDAEKLFRQPWPPHLAVSRAEQERSCSKQCAVERWCECPETL